MHRIFVSAIAAVFLASLLYLLIVGMKLLDGVVSILVFVGLLVGSFIILMIVDILTDEPSEPPPEPPV